ncbi:MAG: G8 domain-containing protein [Cyclobacteriaceae bacterium]
MRLIKYTFLVGLVILSFITSAQQTLTVSTFDTLKLEAGSYRGSLQWESSEDGLQWSDISGATSDSHITTMTQQKGYYRARIEEEGCERAVFSEIIEVNNSAVVKLWSDPATWGSGGKPVAGDEVVIPSEDYILLDESPPPLAGLTINGVLEFDEKDLELTSEWIVIDGALRIGSESAPHTHQAIITLNDTDLEASFMDMGTRGIMVMNGALELHGPVPDVIWTKLNAHADAGSTSLSLIEAPDWRAGDQIVIAPTDYYEAGFGVSVTQRTEIAALSGNELTISSGLNAHRWGLLQYPVSDGMSLSSANVVDPPVPDTDTEHTPLVLDERAEVGNLTRNIVIQAPDDDTWNNEGFGVHTMIMPNATAHVEGVEFRRAGQRARLRRYPFHWHMLSYSGTETLNDAEGQYFRGNTINSSFNRGIVIHGTNGVLVQNNIIYDTRGHGLFTEDAVERRNIIDGNLVLHVRNPDWGYQLLMHEIGEQGSSGFWISNPDNTVTNNVAADCQTFGYWLAYPLHPWGLSQGVLHTDGLVLRPNRLLFGVFDNNTSHSNKNDGIHLDNPQINEDGDTGELQYWSTTDGRTDIQSESFEALRRFSLSRYKTWKNRDNGAWDRGVWTDITGVVSADNCGRFFAGSGADGVIERSLVVGTSLNFMMNGTGRPETADYQFHPSSTPVAFATYHSAFSMRNNIVVNFPVAEYDRAGVFASDDYYLRPVDKGLVRNYDNLMIESHPGVKLKAGYSYFTLASALWDPYGFWGPAENYFVYDDPFLTYGKEISEDPLGKEITGGVSVPGPFYGFYGFVLHGVGWVPPQNQPFNDYMAIHVNRFDVNDMVNPVGTWSVTSAQQSWALNHMRDFATSPDGIYELTFPDEIDHPTNFQMYVENMMEDTDTQVIGIEFDGSVTGLTVRLQREFNGSFSTYDQVNSLQEVRDSEGETWWQDSSNNRVWVKLRGGVWEPKSDDDFDDTLNETMVLRIWAQ